MERVAGGYSLVLDCVPNPAAQEAQHMTTAPTHFLHL